MGFFEQNMQVIARKSIQLAAARGDLTEAESRGAKKTQTKKPLCIHHS